jgi:CRP/FNR family cyclic AMP-dependent transcriptional regulator
MKKILLIEDHQEIRENTSEILQLAGYDVLAAENGKVGIELARETAPDIVVCDIMMPVLDGYGVLHLFRRDDVLQQIPFIFLTAKSERSDQRKAMELGADDYLTKPFTEVELLAAIEARLQKASQGPQRSASPRKLQDAYNQLHSFIKGIIKEEGSELIKYPRRHLLFSEGQYPQYIFWLEKGIIKHYRTTSFGKSLIFKVDFGPEIIGLAEALLPNPYRSFCEAATPLELRAIPREKVIKAISESGAMLMNALQLQADESNRLAEKMLHLAYTPMRERVILETDSIYQRLSENGYADSDKVFSREELAQIAGTATESLIRVLHEK